MRLYSNNAESFLFDKAKSISGQHNSWRCIYIDFTSHKDQCSDGLRTHVVTAEDWRESALPSMRKSRKNSIADKQEKAQILRAVEKELQNIRQFIETTEGGNYDKSAMCG